MMTMDQRRSETSSSEDLSVDWAEARGKTFVVPRAKMMHDEDSASNLDGMSVDRQDLEQLMDVVMERFEEKQTKIKHELRGEFEQKRADDRNEYRQTMTVLKQELSNLTKVSDEYENLKDVQKSLRNQLHMQNENMTHVNQENTRLKATMTQADNLATENQKLRRENENLKKGYIRMESEMKKLEKNISEKDTEMSSLRTHLDTQYRRLKCDITKTCDKWDSEHETLYSGMKQQHLMLADISQSVRVITKNTSVEQERDPHVNGASPQRPAHKPKYRPFITGKVIVSNKEYSTTNKRK